MVLHVVSGRTIHTIVTLRFQYALYFPALIILRWPCATSFFYHYLHFFSKDLNADLNPLLGTVKFYTASS